MFLLRKEKIRNFYRLVLVRLATIYGSRRGSSDMHVSNFGSWAGLDESTLDDVIHMTHRPL